MGRTSSPFTEDEIRSKQEIYPTRRDAVDGSRVWLSRLPSDDRRLASDYERSFSYWIPEPSLDHLLAVWVFARPKEGELVPGRQGREQALVAVNEWLLSRGSSPFELPVPDLD